MKMSSYFCRLAFDPPGRGYILCVLFICATAMPATGCHRKNQDSEIPAAPPPTTQTDASPAAATTPPTVGNAEPAAASVTNALPDLHPLNQALIGWIISNQRHPATFEEFASSTDIQIPPLPPGKKYVLNGRGLISIVNR
jgi:hypothetical protein